MTLLRRTRTCTKKRLAKRLSLGRKGQQKELVRPARLFYHQIMTINNYQYHLVPLSFVLCSRSTDLISPWCVRLVGGKSKLLFELFLPVKLTGQCSAFVSRFISLKCNTLSLYGYWSLVTIFCFAWCCVVTVLLRTREL